MMGSLVASRMTSMTIDSYDAMCQVQQVLGPPAQRQKSIQIID